MITGLDLNQTVDYTLKDDKENPTVWKLGVIPSYLFARISREAEVSEFDTIFKVLQISLKGWENFTSPFESKRITIYGREIEAVPMELLEKIPLRYVTELSLKAMELNQITEIERKN